MSEPSSPSLNWKEIDLVLSELNLPGSLVQEVHQPSHDRFVLSLFRAGVGFAVLISLSSRFPRLHLLSQKTANPPRPPRFASFLRAHLKGGRIESAEQLRGPDGEGQRVVRIEVIRAGEKRLLWIRLWGAAANAVLTDDAGKILDAFYRRPNKGEISGQVFVPIPQSRKPTKETPAKSYTVREIPGSGMFNEKLEAFFHELETRVDVEKLTAAADMQLSISENKLLANLEKLRGRLEEYANLDRFRELGDLITSNLHAVVRGERWLKVEDFFHGNAPVEIELSPALSPAQNAESYYERHRKARLGKSRVEEEIGKLETTLARIQRQRAALTENPDPVSLERTTRRAAQARRPLQSADTPGLVFSSPPFRIIVGRTASENDELLRKKVRGNDWWFHARDWPGAYVFVKAPAGKSLPLETMLDAGNLAVHYSRGKAAGTADVYYTRVKYLRRAKGARKGTVLPTQEKNLRITLDPERIERLKAGAEQEGAEGP